MSNILLGYRQDTDKRGNPITATYSHSTSDALISLGHTVTSIGEGHEITSFNDPIWAQKALGVKDYDLFIDLDCGRNEDGAFNYQCQDERAPIPSAVRFIDSHGHPSYHKRAAVNYDHVFFAVWAKRDLFVKHPSAHWCPNASDAYYFFPNHTLPTIDVGFFGTKGGLSRAEDLKEACAANDWSTDVREIGKKRNRWPTTGEAMNNCRVLYNCGQKHDGPNQRVIESMLVGRPLINDFDSIDGMTQLFTPGTHYLPYLEREGMAEQIKWCLQEPERATMMANRAYEEAYNKHQVKHRVAQILEVALG